MKENELRIGNYILSVDKKVGSVISLAKEGVGIMITELLFSYEFYEKVRPIPLTEEWLLKFGFVKLDTSDIFYILGYNMQLKVSECLNMVAWHNLMLHDVKIEYVHQLQNLYFALTGEELKID